MKQIEFYRTYSFGGGDGRTIVFREFETEELARQNALEDTWNDGFKLYKGVITLNGRITQTETYISHIPCYRQPECGNKCLKKCYNETK